VICVGLGDVLEAVVVHKYEAVSSSMCHGVG
jgi:hypothetical protein